MSMQIPIKGVIAQGIFSYDKENELYFGKPLVDAYLLHEELKYYGIVVHNTAEKTIKKYQNSNNPYTNTPIYRKRTNSTLSSMLEFDKSTTCTRKYYTSMQKVD